VGSSSLEGESVAVDLNHCMGVSFLWMRSSLFVGGWGVLLRSCTLPIFTSLPVCLFVFQAAILFSPECKSYYTKEVLINILDKFSKK
jgi:hypothetical protein